MDIARSVAASTPDDPRWRPLGDDELHLEPLVPFTWRTTLYSLLAWPIPAALTLLWLAVFWVAHHTFWDLGRMLALPRFAARLTLRLMGVRVRVHGAEHLASGGPFVFVGNHVSMLDAPVAAAAGVVNARAFQERSHLRIPIYGSFVRMFDEILVDRSDPASLEAAFTEARERLAEGRSVGLFPEGGRSYDGRLGRFYDGAFRLAIDAQVPVAPACFRGLRNVCPPGEWRIRPGVVDVIYGPPISTAGLTSADVERLRNRARRAINDLLRGAGWGEAS